MPSAILVGTHAPSTRVPARWRCPAVLAPGLTAVGLYWRPILLLQLAALVLVMACAASPAVAAGCDQLSAAHRGAGLAFSAVAAALAGAVLPELAKALVMGDRHVDGRRVRNVVFAAALFAFNGFVTDLRYRGMAVLIGHDAGLTTALRKMLVDQFLVTPLYTTPYWRLAYDWRADRYRLRATLGRVTPGWYWRSVAPLVVTGWAFWVPMTVLIFSLPGPVQFCLFLLAGAGWSLLVVAVASPAKPVVA